MVQQVVINTRDVAPVSKEEGMVKKYLNKAKYEIKYFCQNKRPL